MITDQNLTNFNKNVNKISESSFFANFSLLPEYQMALYYWDVDQWSRKFDIHMGNGSNKVGLSVTECWQYLNIGT